MKRIRIIHKTEYFYNQPVTFGTHRALMRPREGHDVHIVRGAVNIEPKAEVHWLRDNYDNATAILTLALCNDGAARDVHLQHSDSGADGSCCHRRRKRDAGFALSLRHDRGAGRFHRLHDSRIVAGQHVGGRRGHYTVGDFVRIGVPFSVVVLIVCTALVPWLLPI